jgi:proliferating cell nuclear antigen
MSTNTAPPADSSTDEPTETETGSESADPNSFIVEADTLQSIIGAASTLVDECKIRLNEDSLEIAAVDPANVAMIEETLDEAAFETYSMPEDTVGVNLERLKDITGMADSEDLILINLDTEKRKFNITIGSLEWTMSLLDPESIREEPEIPDFDLETDVVINSKDFNRGIKAADQVAEHATLKSDPNVEELQLVGEGDTDSVDLTLDSDDLIEIEPGDAKSIFSMDYLNSIKQGIPSKTELSMELGDEMPIKLHYTFADGNASVTYMVAPRIDSN